MKKTVLAMGALALTLSFGAQAQISDGVVKVGILTDMSGPYSAMGGRGSVVASQMASRIV
ncbi:hypothetical protein JaAD80_10165 [Janthinobacterium sp. AD80]|nr:hypothetical protein JaAD80_10165 [Janthinobacterium sp. AD80]